MVTIAIVINSNHGTKHFALHPAGMHCPPGAILGFLVYLYIYLFIYYLFN